MRFRYLSLRLARIFALGLGIVALFADFLSPIPPDQQDLDMFFAPPTPIHFFDGTGKLNPSPFVHALELSDPLDVRYQERTEITHQIRFFFKGYEYRLFGLIPTSLHLVGSDAGNVFHPLGTDELGRDVFSRILAGGRTTLLVVVSGMIVYFLIGLSIGATAGVLGGWPDALLMRFSEFILALPALYLILALRALLPLKLPFWQAVTITVATIASVAWPPMARGVRGLILQLRSAGYVEAARALGCTKGRIFRTHMLPALAPLALTQTAVAAPLFILGEVTLSFLNVGLGDSGGSWGGMLRNLKDQRVLTDFWWNLAPLGMVFITLFCLNVLAARIRLWNQDRIVM